MFNFFICLLILFCSFFALIAKNALHSLINLILCFFLTALLFYVLGAEFLAVVILVVYAGALAILFLFVVMLLISEL